MNVGDSVVVMELVDGEWAVRISGKVAQVNAQGTKVKVHGSKVNRWYPLDGDFIKVLKG